MHAVGRTELIGRFLLMPVTDDAAPLLASREIVKRFRPLKDRNSILTAPKVRTETSNGTPELT